MNRYGIAGGWLQWPAFPRYTPRFYVGAAVVLTADLNSINRSAPLDMFTVADVRPSGVLVLLAANRETFTALPSLFTLVH